MITVVPVLKMKAFLLMKCYCAYKQGDIEHSKTLFNKYLTESVNELEFQHVDRYMGDLTGANSIQKIL